MTRVVYSGTGAEQRPLEVEAVAEELTRQEADEVAREFRAQGRIARVMPSCGWAAAPRRRRVWAVMLGGYRARRAPDTNGRH